MKNIFKASKFFWIVLLIFFMVYLSAVKSLSAEKADYIYQNAKIYTVDQKKPWAQSIAIKGNKIIYVGDSKRVVEFKGPATKIIDVKGKMILPGMIDSHVHPIWGGKMFVEVNLTEAKTIEQVQKILKAYRAAHPDAKYILGGGWKTANFPDEGPKKEDIDAVISDVPVLLYDHFGHTAWVNSKALELADIDKDTANPEGGYFVRDPKNNAPTGTVREDAAIKMLHHIFPANEEELRYKSMKMALKYLNKQGITSFVTAYMVGDPLGETFIDLYKNKDLTARTILSFKVNKEISAEEIVSKLEKRRETLNQIDPNFIKADMIKLFLDGIVLSYTAAMTEPYVGEYKQQNSEGYLFTNEELNKYTKNLDKAGYQLHFHAVGDGAARQALDTIEYLNKVNGKRDRRATISHLLLVSPNDFDRFKELDVYANAQFLWTQHHEVISAVEEHLGPKRSQSLYPYGSLYKAGAKFVGGSDWPVSTASPFAAMQAAATRPYVSLHGHKVDKPKNAVWLPQHLMEVKAMIEAFTLNGARLQGREEIIGSLEVGKMADFIIINQNILEVPAGKIGQTKVLTTVVDGKVVFKAED